MGDGFPGNFPPEPILGDSWVESWHLTDDLRSKEQLKQKTIMLVFTAHGGSHGWEACLIGADPLTSLLICSQRVCASAGLMPPPCESLAHAHCKNCLDVIALVLRPSSHTLLTRKVSLKLTKLNAGRAFPLPSEGHCSLPANARKWVMTLMSTITLLNLSCSTSHRHTDQEQTLADNLKTSDMVSWSLGVSNTENTSKQQQK